MNEDIGKEHPTSIKHIPSLSFTVHRYIVPSTTRPYVFREIEMFPMLENDSKLNHIGSYLVGVLNIYLFYFIII